MPRMPQSGWNLEHSFKALDSRLYADQGPVPVKSPSLLGFNDSLAGMLGLPDQSADSWAEILSGNQLPPGAAPIALAYAGHQFGHFTRLGDGRAILLGEQITPAGDRYDLQLKGSGQTPYSRRGDGRATLSAMLREYLISEAMHHLGIPTTRSLAVVATGEHVYRERVHAGAVLTRVARSHLRVGTLEYIRQYLPGEVLDRVVKYTLERHYPYLAREANAGPALLRAVQDATISLVVEWMRVGFIHGVMNTDNTSLSGETIDYGPCAFMNDFDPATVFSSIDAGGRYAFGQQPRIGHWNMAILAGALLPLIHADEKEAILLAREVLDGYEAAFQQSWYMMMGKKIGLSGDNARYRPLVDELLTWMKTNALDYTNTFLALSFELLPSWPEFQQQSFVDWYQRWLQCLGRQPGGIGAARKLMLQTNPMVIPRNHLVESVLSRAEQGDLAGFEELLRALSFPYATSTSEVRFQLVPDQYDARYQTFCGT